MRCARFCFSETTFFDEKNQKLRRGAEYEREEERLDETRKKKIISFLIYFPLLSSAVRVPQRVRGPGLLQVRRREPPLRDQRLVEGAEVGGLAGADRGGERLRGREHRAEGLQERVALREELAEARVVGGSLGGVSRRKRKERGEGSE